MENKLTRKNGFPKFIISVFLMTVMAVFSTPGNVPLAKAQTATTSTKVVIYLSDLSPVLKSNGWGPYEKNMSNGEKLAGDGKTLTLNGATFGKGLGVHAGSELVYKIPGICSSFTAKVGVDDEVSKGSVIFSVYGNGAKMYDSGKMTHASTTKSVSLNITGKKELKLKVGNAGDDLHGDHGDWADAKIVCTGDSIEPTPKTTAIKVLQWNNGGEVGKESDQIKKIVAEKPQIVFMQEVDSKTFVSRVLTALKEDQGGNTWDSYTMLRGADTSSSHVAIISKYDLTNERYVDLRKTGTYGISCYRSGTPIKWAGRRAVGANVTVDGNNISVFVVRTSSAGDMNCVRKDEVTTLKTWANDAVNGFYSDQMFGGDFNMQPGNSEYRTWTEAPNAHVDTWKTAVIANTATAENDSTPDFYTPTRNTRMDYIFTNTTADLMVKAASILNVGTLSDHRMITTNFEVK